MHNGQRTVILGSEVSSSNSYSDAIGGLRREDVVSSSTPDETFLLAARGWYMVPTYKNGALDAILTGTAAGMCLIGLGSARRQLATAMVRTFDHPKELLFSERGYVASSVSAELRGLIAMIRARATLTVTAELRTLAEEAVKGLGQRQSEDLDEWSRRLAEDVSRVVD